LGCKTNSTARTAEQWSVALAAEAPDWDVKQTARSITRSESELAAPRVNGASFFKFGNPLWLCSTSGVMLSDVAKK
jgi:hypothetical protein